MRNDSKKPNWPKRIVLSIALFIVALVIDISIARLADRIVLSRDAEFAEQLESTDLDFRGPRTQGCSQRYVFKIYLYQTCFVKNASFDDQNRWYFTYIYQGPSARLLGGSDKNSLKFKEFGIGKYLKIVNFDGSVSEIASRYN